VSIEQNLKSRGQTKENQILFN